MSVSNQKKGYCAAIAIYHSLKDPVPLPPPTQSLDITSYVFSHHHTTDLALIDAPTGCSLSYAALRRNVKSLSAALHRLGIRKGDVVLVLSPNSIHIPCIYMAIFSIGAILTTANPLNTESEILNQVTESNPAIVFASPDIVPKARTTQRTVVAIHNEKEEQRGCVATLSELLQCSVNDAPTVDIQQEDTATLLYSSGTTGKSKGVIGSHRNYIAWMAGFASGGNVVDGVVLMTMPMFHVYGFLLTLSLLAKGSTVVVMPKFDFALMLWSVQRYRVRNLPTSPPVFVALTKSPLVEKYNLSSLEHVGSGGAPLGKEVIDEFARRFPNVEIGQGYGLTESCGGVTFASSAEGNKYGTAGLLAANMEAKIVDTVTGEALPPNQRGELWLRGPSIMKGYYNNKEATAVTLDSEGWLKTGDLCYIDEEGFLFVVDRIKELIKYKGFQVAPAELEEILLSQPQIADCAVIPYPDDEAGQIPMAFIVRKSGSKLKEENVMSFVSKQVAPYKKIRRVAFVNSIPKSQSGKILRKDLIQQTLSTPKL